MTTFRAFYKNQRIATGKDYKNNTFLQVYPCVKEFETRTDWILAWYKAISEDVRIVKEEEDVPVPAPAPSPAAAPRPSHSKKSMPASEAIFTILARETTEKKAVAPPPAPAPTVSSILVAPTTKDWSFRKELTYTAPAGTYYIGDLCYALYENIYDNVFGGRGYEPGFYSKGPSFFMVDGTAYGDGNYKGSDGYHYLVDAGIIGICSADLVDPLNRSIEGGKVHTFTEPVTIRFKGGMFYFTSGYTHIEINTQGLEDDEEEDDY